MARHTTCDVCGEDTRTSARRISVYVARLARDELGELDDTDHDLCDPCWDWAWQSMVHRVRTATSDLAKLMAEKTVDRMGLTKDELAQRISTRIAGGRVAVPLADGRVQVTVPVTPNEDGEFPVNCPACSATTDLLAVDYDEVEAVANADGTYTHISPTLSCGCVNLGLTVVREPHGTITSATVIQKNPD